MDPASVPTPLPDLVLWRGDGCHLCDEARALVSMLLAERSAAGLRSPALIERRIADDPAVERALVEQIPVLELDGRRLPLAIRAGPVRAFLGDVLGGPEVGGDATFGGPGVGRGGGGISSVARSDSQAVAGGGGRGDDQRVAPGARVDGRGS